MNFNATCSLEHLKLGHVESPFSAKNLQCSVNFLDAKQAPKIESNNRKNKFEVDRQVRTKGENVEVENYVRCTGV
jgi:hypothetical protein